MTTLFRLEGGRERFSFPTDQGELAIFAHHPTQEEVSASIAEAGINLRAFQEQGADTLEGAEQAARFGYAQELLACYCIERAELAGEALPIKRVRGRFGMRRLDAESEESLADVLLPLGVKLHSLSKPTATEGEG
jgi:hypothetical protein